MGRQVLSWVSFLYCEAKFKQSLKDYRQMPSHERLDAPSLLLCSALVGVVNLALVLPLDTIKTQYQMKENALVLSTTYRQNISRLYSQ